jgi:hypothetical protein
MLFRICCSELLVGVSDHVLVKLRKNNGDLMVPRMLVYDFYIAGVETFC